jgi:hypothetical protein
MSTRLLASISTAFIWSGLPGPAQAQDFEVMVLRGSQVVKVTGDGTGAISEATLREAPAFSPVPSAEKTPRGAGRRDEPIVIVNEVVATIGAEAIPLFPSFRKPPSPARIGRSHGRGLRSR